VDPPDRARRQRATILSAARAEPSVVRVNAIGPSPINAQRAEAEHKIAVHVPTRLARRLR
jgi:hypothetical protein